MSGIERARLGIRGELSLAVPPTIVVLGAVYLMEQLEHERVLFASLASSAFLIYADPGHAMNGLRRMTLAHVIATAFGVGTAVALGAGYLAAAIAMSATIVTIVPLDLFHPPAVSTALGFGFFASQQDALATFFVALALVVSLVVIQRGATRTLARAARRRPPEGRS